MSVSTEGRVFVAQMTRDIRQRMKLGAGLLSPGATNWQDALQGFGHEMAKAKGGSPIAAAKIFTAAHARLKVAQQEHNACFLNFYHRGKRSGMFELMTYEVATHPLTSDKEKEGVEMASYLYMLHRGGYITMYGKRAAYISWHALARMHERVKTDLFDANGVVGLIGIAGLMLRGSSRHRHTSVNLTFEGPYICTGVMRSFFDCITVLEDAEKPKYAAQLEQGRIISHLAIQYMKGDDVDPRPLQKMIPVVPHTREDYASTQLKLKGEHHV